MQQAPAQIIKVIQPIAVPAQPQIIKIVKVHSAPQPAPSHGQVQIIKLIRDNGPAYAQSYASALPVGPEPHLKIIKIIRAPQQQGWW